MQSKVSVIQGKIGIGYLFAICELHIIVYIYLFRSPMELNTICNCHLVRLIWPFSYAEWHDSIASFCLAFT
ncbi:hypothetical protein Hanom_Chr06g00502131 [Helianthus anomalus]